MCILIMIPSKAQKPGEDILTQCWRSNPDGAGFMYPDRAASRLVVSKGHMTLDALKEAFAKVPEGVPVSLHFRIKTHGAKNADMTHPHWVWPDEVAIAHNGILPIGAPADSPESDTARFARMVLSNLPKTWWKNDALVHLIEEYMGRGNKLIAMNAAGSYKILNETAGTWEQGVWFSNQTFRVSRTYNAYSSYGPDDGYTGWSGGGRTWETHQGRWQKPVEAGKASSPPSGTKPAVTGASSPSLSPVTVTVKDRVTEGIAEAIGKGELTQDDLNLMVTDIGTMTDAEWNRYQVLMEGVYGV